MRRRRRHEPGEQRENRPVALRSVRAPQRRAAMSEDAERRIALRLDDGVAARLDEPVVPRAQHDVIARALLGQPKRSEERRVGKECRARWSTDAYKNKR